MTQMRLFIIAFGKAKILTLYFIYNVVLTIQLYLKLHVGHMNF